MEGNGKNGEANTELLRMLVDAVNTLTTEVVTLRVDLGARIDNTNARLDQTNARLDQTNAELVRTREELGARIDTVKDEVIALKAATSANFELLARADSRHGHDDHELRDRVERIEQHLGLQPAP